MNNNFAIVKLSGRKSSQIKLVKKEVFNWIISKASFDEKSIRYDEIPPAVKEEMKKENNGTIYTVCITKNSYKTDRAILAPGKNFPSESSLIAYAKENKINITEQFEEII